MFKIYQTPSVKIVCLSDADLIVTSPGGKASIGVNESDTDADTSDKAPNRGNSIWNE